ncbi:type IV pilus modification protein PilV [Dyella soli]|uniref:Type IV pilus modification protein PilV n=2 Tax=Dyella soli TaxID=522319 RepID=A0A4R0YRE1_9GAMM|nr:type IV pilus modification protein PilV [Dyella soli]
MRSGLAGAGHRQAGARAGLGRRRRQQAGVGLIEVLVAVLILSIAFLGIAALQAMSLSTNNSAMARSMATISSYSILDAMRADYANATTGAAYNTTTPLKANACPTGTASLAAAQLSQWCNQLGSNLGVAATTTGAINCSAAGDCTITITFDDSRAGVGGSSTQTVVTRAML